MEELWSLLIINQAGFVAYIATAAIRRIIAAIRVCTKKQGLESAFRAHASHTTRRQCGRGPRLKTTC
jgi:hypothetical protein